jgi:hypothetical protein
MSSLGFWGNPLWAAKLAYLGVPINPLFLTYFSGTYVLIKADNPKSIIINEPLSFLIIFWGFRSWCTIPF